VSVRVALYFRVVVDPAMGRDRVYRRVVELPGVPRVGDRIELTDGGWSEPVRDVWWQYDGTVMIEFRTHATDSAGEEILAITNRLDSSLVYVDPEDLAALEPAGWERM
jgi:hypothetical protein